jgi:hypothetical protein
MAYRFVSVIAHDVSSRMAARIGSRAKHSQQVRFQPPEDTDPIAAQGLDLVIFEVVAMDGRRAGRWGGQELCQDASQESGREVIEIVKHGIKPRSRRQVSGKQWQQDRLELGGYLLGHGLIDFIGGQVGY